MSSITQSIVSNELNDTISTVDNENFKRIHISNSLKNFRRMPSAQREQESLTEGEFGDKDPRYSKQNRRIRSTYENKIT